MSVDVEGVGNVTPPASLAVPRQVPVRVKWEHTLGLFNGRERVWQNGTLVIDTGGIRTIPFGDVVYNRFEIGQTINASPNPHTVWFDDVAFVGRRP